MTQESFAPSLRPPRHTGRRILKGTLFAVLLVVVAALSMMAGFYVAIARSLPSLQLAENISTEQTTEIYDDSTTPVLLAELHGIQTRDVLPPDEIPKVARDALVALEDERFYEHSGVDFLGILRAAWASLTHGEVVEGGSTITQLLIKNVFLTGDMTVNRKLQEAALAYQLEKRWSKEKILDEYLNIAYFGEGAYGIEAAAKSYFDKHASELSLAEAALLVGLPQGPSAYEPRRSPEAALAQRDVCLNKMYQQGYITSQELQTALSTPLQLADPMKQDDDPVPYWIEMVREQLVAHYGASTVLSGGLRVYISVDLNLQKAAEDTVAQVLNQPGDPAAALVCVDVRTGRLVAMVGGDDFSQQEFNLATQGKRQPGSAFKPFVLVTALEQGMSPDITYPSGPAALQLAGGTWNVTSEDEGPLSLDHALADSSNGVYARLIMDVGADKVAKTAHDMGIEAPFDDNPDPAMALGGPKTGVSPLEMAMAYATLATGGLRLSSQVAFDPGAAGYPITIVKVTDAAGGILDEDSPATTRVIDKDVAVLTTSCLEQVIASGSGMAADIGRPAAGTAGTTTDYDDAWFIGYTPELVTAVWVGYPAGQKPMTDVHGITVTGGSLPAKIWAGFMKRALANVPVSDFEKPSDEGWVSVLVCSESHELPTEYCPTVVSMRFRAGSQPATQCTIHVAAEVPVPAVVGLSLDSAKAKLAEARFSVQSSTDDNSSAPAGTVLAQTPRAGWQLMQGQTVRLVVSSGVALTEVPALTGLDITTARARLGAAGLLSDERLTVDPTTAGTVLSQSPAPGTKVPGGTAVTLVVSSGPEFIPQPAQ